MGTTFRLRKLMKRKRMMRVVEMVPERLRSERIRLNSFTLFLSDPATPVQRLYFCPTCEAIFSRV
ncbi:MAG: hypothetical protein BWY86_00949 [Candidatus Aminicenantes bacterium ADurb.Bin508]|nr:MAG: hypothetical protein BWY86_00949 [Candidatus Aminicenantes bacterium ADurb.Bin508]